MIEISEDASERWIRLIDLHIALGTGRESSATESAESGWETNDLVDAISHARQAFRQSRSNGLGVGRAHTEFSRNTLASWRRAETYPKGALQSALFKTFWPRGRSSDRERFDAFKHALAEAKAEHRLGRRQGPFRKLTLDPFPWRPSKALSSPRQVSDVAAEFAHPTYALRYDDEPIGEIAMLLEPMGQPWLAQEISWRAIRQPFRASEFWRSVDAEDLVPLQHPTDEDPRKHLRLVAASRRRAATPDDRTRLDFVWQPVSWYESCRTNGRIDRGVLFGAAPLYAWFNQEDLLPPPAGESSHRDTPLANRLAINLAVVVAEPSGRNFALCQIRSRDLAFHPMGLECGVSESIHGDSGWPSNEQDVQDGVPDLERTARRCVWQELGISDRRLKDSDVRAFKMDIRFTALVVNKKEMSPRLLGYVEIEGWMKDIRESAIASTRLEHREFGIRPDKDAVAWDRVRMLPMTRESYASIHQHPLMLCPECRARILLYLKDKFPTSWNVRPEVVEDIPWIRNGMVA